MPLIFMAAAIMALVGAFRVEGSASRTFQVLFALFLFALGACAAWGGNAVGWAGQVSLSHPDDPLHVLLTRGVEFAVRVGIFLTTGIVGAIAATLAVVLSLSVVVGMKVVR